MLKSTNNKIYNNYLNPKTIVMRISLKTGNNFLKI